MPTVRYLLLTAVFPEARALARAFHLVEAKSVLPLWKREEWALAVVGVGANRLGELSGIAELAGVQVVIMAGVAGALSPALRVGDVVVDGRGRFARELPRAGKPRFWDGCIRQPPSWTARKKRLDYSQQPDVWLWIWKRTRRKHLRRGAGRLFWGFAEFRMTQRTQLRLNC